LHSQTIDPEEQVNKSNQDVHVWRMNGDNGENNSESLILLLLFEGIHTFLALLKLFEENEMLYIFFFFSLSPNSTVGHLSIFTYCLTFFFFRGSEHLPLLFPHIFFFFRALTSLNNVASGSNQDNLSIYFTGEN